MGMQSSFVQVVVHDIVQFLVGLARTLPRTVASSLVQVFSNHEYNSALHGMSIFLKIKFCYKPLQYQMGYTVLLANHLLYLIPLKTAIEAASQYTTRR